MKIVKIILILATLAFGGFFGIKSSSLINAQVRSGKDNPFANWRPTKEVAGINYVGNQKCLNCHAEKEQLGTPMAHAILKPSDSKILDEFPSKPFKNGDYIYEVKKQGGDITYTVSDGKNKQSFPVLYSFGEGRKAQVYIFRYKDALYESRVSFYRGIKGLDFTVAQPQQVPTTLENAVGREIPKAELQNCFGCHSTGAVKEKKLNFDHLNEAISCEACHGPGENHIKAVVSEDANGTQIFNPANLIPLEQTQEFCGACHIGFEQELNMPEGVNTIRFQPYRLFSSKSHDPNDARLSCTACHNPHEKLEENPIAYDAKCFTCHVSSPTEKMTKERFAPACPVKTTNCVTCHMPKTDVPEMHYKFTDHLIRVVRPNEKIEK
ncbi:MAG: hypothetical protein M3T96_09095 [Acidobacteriota bacterium]|nr:hypothetical protein [Acidobacteriota bacterium]